MIFLHIEPILNVNEFNYNLPNYFLIMKCRKSIILVFVLLLCTTVAWAQQYQQVNDISYTESADAYAQERCKLDVYYPTDQNDVPVVIWFHGGGIEGGSKHIDPQLKNISRHLKLK